MKRLARQLAMSGILVGLGMLTVGCGKTQDTITFYNYGANIDEETLKAFEEEYGIQVKMKLCIKSFLIVISSMMWF